MSPFPDKLYCDNAGMRNGKRTFVVTKEFVAITSRGLIRVPVGFIFDGASIPKIAWSIIGCPFDEYLEESVIHDWLYSAESNDNCSRLESDLILKELMWNKSVQFWKIPAFYSAVRIGGWVNYKKS